MSRLRIRLSENSYFMALWEEVHLLITQHDWQTISSMLPVPSLARLLVIRAILTTCCAIMQFKNIL